MKLTENERKVAVKVLRALREQYDIPSLDSYFEMGGKPEDVDRNFEISTVSPAEFEGDGDDTVKSTATLKFKYHGNEYYGDVDVTCPGEYIETYHDNGSYWDPPESDGYCEFDLDKAELDDEFELALHTKANKVAYGKQISADTPANAADKLKARLKRDIDYYQDKVNQAENDDMAERYQKWLDDAKKKYAEFDMEKEVEKLSTERSNMKRSYSNTYKGGSNTVYNGKVQSNDFYLVGKLPNGKEVKIGCPDLIYAMDQLTTTSEEFESFMDELLTAAVDGSPETDNEEMASSYRSAQQAAEDEYNRRNGYDY